MRENELIGASELCKKLGISKRRLSYLQELFLIEPTHNFAGHRVFTPEDVAEIKRIDTELKNKK